LHLSILPLKLIFFEIIVYAIIFLGIIISRRATQEA
jgi:hypothetical protein